MSYNGLDMDLVDSVFYNSTNPVPVPVPVPVLIDDDYATPNVLLFEREYYEEGGFSRVDYAKSANANEERKAKKKQPVVYIPQTYAQPVETVQPAQEVQTVKGHKFGHRHGCPFKYKRKERHKHGKKKFMKKYLLPLGIGIIIAKAILLPMILKLLAVLASKGIILGLVSTILATILSLKKLLEPSHVKYEGKRDVTKIEVVPIPIHREKHTHSHSYKHDDYHDIDDAGPPPSGHHPYYGHYDG